MEKPKAKVYCSKHCGPCIALCEWLDTMGVPYEKITDRWSFPLGVVRVPTFEFGGETVSGFDRVSIMRLLKRHNAYPGQ